MPQMGSGPFGFPGSKGPNKATKFALAGEIFVGGVAIAAGHFALAATSVVLIEGEQDAVRTNHNQRLLFGRATAVAATPGAPWYLWVPKPTQIEPEEDARRGNHTLLHTYRVGYQTVGQPQFLLSWKTSTPNEPEPYDVHTASPDLHRYRQAFQTVGQGFRQWPGAQKRIDEADYELRKPVDLSPYRNSSPVVAVVGAPWYLWVSQPKQVEPEDDARRVNQTVLHRYRTGYQTVGQSWQYWGKPAARTDEAEYVIPRPVDLTPYRNSSPVTATVGAPWYLWPRVAVDQTVEPNPPPIDHAALLYPFRPHDAIQPPTPPDDARPVFAAPGRSRYVAFINGKRFIGSYVEIQEVIEEFAQTQATKNAQTTKKVKKPRIVIQSGKTVDKQPAMSAESTLQFQKDARNFYDRAYAQAMLDIEQDEEDAIIMLLS